MRRHPRFPSPIRFIRFNRHECELLQRIKMREAMVNHLHGFADVRLRRAYHRDAA